VPPRPFPSPAGLSSDRSPVRPRGIGRGSPDGRGAPRQRSSTQSMRSSKPSALNALPARRPASCGAEHGVPSRNTQEYCTQKTASCRAASRASPPHTPRAASLRVQWTWTAPRRAGRTPRAPCRPRQGKPPASPQNVKSSHKKAQLAQLSAVRARVRACARERAAQSLRRGGAGRGARNTQGPRRRTA